MQAKQLPLYQIELSDRRPPGSRVSPSSTLKRRISEHGIVEPLVVRPIGAHSYELLTNPQAYLAAGALALQEVPVVVREDLTDDEAQKIVKTNYVESAADPIAEAEGLRDQLEQLGGAHNIAKLARVLDRSRSQISRQLALLDLPGETQQALRDGTLSPTHGRILVAVSDPARRRYFTKQALANNWSSAELERRIKAKDVVAEKPTTKSSEVERLEMRLMDHVGMQVDINEEEGTIAFNYHKDLDALQGLIDKLGYSEEF